MEKANVCPLCHSNECKIEPHTDWGNSDVVACKLGYKFALHQSVQLGTVTDTNRRLNIIYSILLRNPTFRYNGINNYYQFFYDEYEAGQPIHLPYRINLADYMSDYPRDFSTRTDAILLNLVQKYPVYGEEFGDDRWSCRLLYCESSNVFSEVKSTYDLLREINYIATGVGTRLYRISADGWKRIGELQKAKQGINQGFIAMSFRTELQPVGEAFKKAIITCGYRPCRIDEKEHNNQIVPEILFEISRSRFLVVDVTYPNYGAYYEAGYGEALKKQVIVCCRKDVFSSDSNKPHFDISQKSMIVWDDAEDLTKKLVKRIEATVGMHRPSII